MKRKLPPRPIARSESRPLVAASARPLRGYAFVAGLGFLLAAPLACAESTTMRTAGSAMPVTSGPGTEPSVDEIPIDVVPGTAPTTGTKPSPTIAPTIAPTGEPVATPGGMRAVEPGVPISCPYGTGATSSRR